MGRTDAHSGLVALLGGAAVLVVEDDADVRDAMRLLLENLGARVIEAADGADALAQLDTTSPDLLVSDLAMPRLDGAALIRRLRRAPETAGLPAIAVSAVASAGDAAAPTRGGFDAQLAKPFDEVSLWAALQEVMRRRPSLFMRRLAHLRGSAQQERRRAREVRQRAGAQLARAAMRRAARSRPRTA